MFCTIFKQTHWLNFILCPVHYFNFTVAICNSNTPDKKFKKPVRLMFSMLTIESIQFGSDKMDCTWTSGHVGGQEVFTMSLIRRTSGNFSLFRPLMSVSRVLFGLPSLLAPSNKTMHHILSKRTPSPGGMAKH